MTVYEANRWGDPHGGVVIAVSNDYQPCDLYSCNGQKEM